jgi:hypothetical protein
MTAGCKGLKRHREQQSSNNLPVVESTTLNPERVVESTTTTDVNVNYNGGVVGDYTTRFDENGGNASNPVVVDYTTHSANQLDESSGADCNVAPGKSSPGETPAKVLPLRPRNSDSIGVPVDELRDWTNAVLQILDRGGQRKIAAAAGINDSYINRFRAGGSLPARLHVAVQMACSQFLPHSEWQASSAHAAAPSPQSTQACPSLAPESDEVHHA